MNNLALSPKGQELVALYNQMAVHGYDRQDQTHVDVAFSDFELRAYRMQVQQVLLDNQISSVLDYGCGGSNWYATGFDPESQQSAVEYFQLSRAWRYEPARDIDERKPVDCVISFDVLEHIFIADVPNVLRDMFSYANKLLILNIACYPAAARLPNGENAHITVRDPLWWKGLLDAISVEFPQTKVWLICSTGWRQSSDFKIWRAEDWQNSSTFVIED
jgi:hypothetical protein